MNSLQFDDSNKCIFQSFDPRKPELQSHDLNVNNPYGKITCFVLYLYSMELSQPALYYDVNRVCRTMDMRYLKTLGPFIRVLGAVTYVSEMGRDEDDKI